MSNRLNLMAPEIRENPYPFFAELRRNAPVCQVDPGGMWAVSRYEDVVHVLKTPQLFSSEGMRLATEAPWLGRSNPVSDSMLFLDPPKHGRLRALVSRAFTPATLARLEPGIRARAGELVTELLNRRSVDFVEDFAMPVPASVIGSLLGLDPSLHSRFKLWANDIIAIGGTRPDDTRQQEQCRRTVVEMETYLQEVLDNRRAALGDDMVSELIRARVDGESLTNEELMGFLFLLLLAGLETTTNLLSHSARMLAAHPDVMARLRADPSLIPRFIEEVLRYEPPSQATLRVCTRDVVLGGVNLPRGAPVLLLQASATHDERQFPDPERFNIDREGQQSLPFGHGIHFCLGAPLARLEARVALDVLLARVGRVELRTERVDWVPSLTIRGAKTLPVEVWPA
ncbi:MAG TPA: cytochrome P450 [Archangium sp.]|jgi:cytochrome P450|uniref:cytochrome P450 n=1 Tax=Archangium sp. TaxID=1872627 RepID=UPI002EDBAF7C